MPEYSRIFNNIGSSSSKVKVWMPKTATVNVTDGGFIFNTCYLDVYTDETQAINLKLSDCSNDTDENNKDSFNRYDDYKFAKFDKGSWNFNYFRNGFNRGNTELSKTELVRACNYIYYNPSTKQNEVHVITEEDLKKSPLYKSDNRSLIYGKYIVARFIFNNDDAAHRFKLENITFNIQQY